MASLNIATDVGLYLQGELPDNRKDEKGRAFDCEIDFTGKTYLDATKRIRALPETAQDGRPAYHVEVEFDLAGYQSNSETHGAIRQFVKGMMVASHRDEKLYFEDDDENMDRFVATDLSSRDPVKVIITTYNKADDAIIWEALNNLMDRIEARGQGAARGRG